MIKKIFLFFSIISFSALSQTTQIAWRAFSSGFGESSSSTLYVKSIMGQSFAGIGNNGTSTIGSGFFYNPDAAGTITAINNYENEIPVIYELFQNYPNPFNPSTTIEYSIPSVGTQHASSLQTVTLKVYDVLGREATTLVNENQAPGNYEINFDATNLPSGIYFYELSAGDFHQTKKMILLK